jgi:DNA-directed RNA polymerase specialized sigma24 family protein
VTGDLHEAEEVVQEAFARASLHWTRLRDYDLPEAWVRRVAMNLATDRARTLQRQGVNGPLTPVSFPGAPSTLAFGLNDVGTITGTYSNPDAAPGPQPTATPPMGRVT